MQYYIMTADHTLGSLIVEVIPVSPYCWSQVDTLCNSKSELHFTTLYLEAFAPKSVRHSHLTLHHFSIPLVSHHPPLL
jgi:hypothetical protein